MGVNRRSLGIALLIAVLTGTASAASLPYRMFDGHPHPVADDMQRYPRAPDAGNPAAAFPGAFVMPPGVGGQPGGLRSTERAETDIDKRVLTWMDQQGVEAIADVQKRGSYGTDNRYTVDAAAAHPKRLFAVVILDSQDATAPAQLRDLIRNHGIAEPGIVIDIHDHQPGQFDSGSARDSPACQGVSEGAAGARSRACKIRGGSNLSNARAYTQEGPSAMAER